MYMYHRETKHTEKNQRNNPTIFFHDYLCFLSAFAVIGLAKLPTYVSPEVRGTGLKHATKHIEQSGREGIMEDGRMGPGFSSVCIISR